MLDTDLEALIQQLWDHCAAAGTDAVETLADVLYARYPLGVIIAVTSEPAKGISHWDSTMRGNYHTVLGMTTHLHELALRYSPSKDDYA